MIRSLVEALHSWARTQPDTVAYRFLVDGDCDGEVRELTYGQLGRRAHAVAGRLQELGLGGSRVMLLYPPGWEFVCGYLGALSAGAVAVPAVPPQGRAQSQRTLSRLKRLVVDADAKAILGPRSIIDALDELMSHVPELAGVARLAAEEIPDEAADRWQEPAISADSVAFLQYTSGSTSAPRGVMVTHGNLMHNQQVITEALGLTPEARERCGGELYVSWLPTFHDMGLIGPVLNALFLGGTTTLLSPLHFLHRPERWLTAISRYRPHVSGGPNFAYELCVRQAGPEPSRGLDLSSWRVAFNGAEPVRAETLGRFAETFAGAGFRREAFFPCYGLAEATLIVTGGPADRAPTVLDWSDGETAGAGRELVGCGRPGPGLTVLIVDGERRAECAEGEVGEIWVAGESVARGYWRNTPATREVFRGSLADGRGGFLRTGDLGFLRGGELFVTGRLKDLLVIDGRNHYPQDLELSAEKAHPALRPGCTAAFSVEDGARGESPVIVAEAPAQAATMLDEIKAVIRSRVGEAHGLTLRDVVLISPGTIPKTSSGKIQRRASRAAYLDGTLSVLSSSGLGEG